MSYVGSTVFPGSTTFPGIPDDTPPPTGAAIDHYLEILLGGVWVDVTAISRAGQPVDYVTGAVTVDQQQRDTEIDAPQPGTLTATLDNRDGLWTPDNPLSPYVADFRLGAPIRYRLSVGADAAYVFRGKIRSIRPTLGDASYTGTVAIVATDILGDMEGQTLGADLAERWRANSLTQGGESNIWMFGEADGSTAFANSGTASPARHARIVYARPDTSVGEATHEEPNGLTVDGAINVTDDDGRGPVVLAQHDAGQKSMMVWLQFDQLAPYLPEYSTLASGRNAAGEELWALRYRESGPGTNVFRLELQVAGSFAVVDTHANDGAWHSFVWANDAPGLTSFYYDKVIAEFIATFDLTDQTAIVLGGQMNPAVRGGQVHCMTATYAALMTSTRLPLNLETYAQSGTVTSAKDRFDDLMGWRNFSAAWTMLPPDTRDVAASNPLGRTLADCTHELATTIGGTIWHAPQANRVELLLSKTWHPQEPAATIVLGQDDDIDAGHDWGLSASNSPTRATGVCPAGSSTFIDADAELYGQVVDAGEIQTCAAMVEDARSVASWQVQRVRRLSLSSFGVDLCSAVNGAALAPALLNLSPGTRFRVADIDPRIFGLESMDVHALGWKLEVSPGDSGAGRAVWTFQCLPGDSPAESTLDHLDYGRLSFDGDAALTVAVNESASTLTFATAGPPLTVDAAAYPLDLRVGAEQVTVSSPPGSATSPQTVTVTRGVGSSVAYAHPVGERVDVAFPAALGI